MNDLTLLVMAAGMGSRYGGLKQLDEIGPYGETIIDYSVYDAIQSGYNKVVFIIRKDFKDQFKQKISNKYSGQIHVEIVYQDLNDLPDNFNCPSSRTKPWGTGHAVLAARSKISEPFVVINGDDFYGRESFEILANYYSSKSPSFTMVAFQLDKTLSNFGSVSRGLCEVKNGSLINVVETHGLEKNNGDIISDRKVELNGKELVSMNMFGFTPELFSHLKTRFKIFLDIHNKDEKSEFLIPAVVNDLIHEKRQTVDVFKTTSKWFGVTYKEDKNQVIGEIKNLIENGSYPRKLFT